MTKHYYQDKRHGMSQCPSDLMMMLTLQVQGHVGEEVGHALSNSLRACTARSTTQHSTQQAAGCQQACLK
jgi:hypothetical protein